MKYAFLLYKNMTYLGAQEIISLARPLAYNRIDNLLIAETEGNKAERNKSLEKLSQRLAYTNSIYSLIFESNYEDFISNMGSFDWGSVYKGSFCIRVHKIGMMNVSTLKNNPIKNTTYTKKKANIKNEFNKDHAKNTNLKNTENYNAKTPVIDKLYTEKKLASFIWRKVKNPKVDLESPKTHIDIFFTEKRIYCCLLLKKMDEYYESRRSHLRPRPSPISLHPRLAKAMVNLTGAEEEETILDPFCGSGGILIEAGLMGLKTEGFDISRKMVWKSMVNLRHYGIKDCNFGVKDFFKIKKKCNYIVADFPYGLNTSIMGNVRVTRNNRKQIKKYLEKFYSGIIKKLEKILLKKAVVIFPSYFNYRKFIKKSKLKLLNEFDSYVHGNLTRKIVVLEK